MAKGQISDVVVVGAGIFGLCCAWACAARGLSVTVFDQGKTGSGASGGIVGAMAPHVPEIWDEKKQFQLEALRAAGGFWRSVDQCSGLASGYGRIGRVIPLTSAKALALAQEREVNHPDLWGADFAWRVHGDVPDFLNPEIARYGIIHETLAARIAPARACASLAKAVQVNGAVIREDCRIDHVESGAVHGAFGRVRAKTIILASGVPGFDMLEAILGRVAGSGVKGQAALLQCDLGAQPQIFADGIYIIPHHGGLTAVGSTSERAWLKPDQTDDLLDDLVQRAAKISPPLQGAKIVQCWAGVRPRAHKPDPMLGPLPGMEGVFLATGAYKIGFGIAHKIGEVLADYACGLPVELPSSFSVSHHLGQVKAKAIGIAS